MTSNGSLLVASALLVIFVTVILASLALSPSAMVAPLVVAIPGALCAAAECVVSLKVRTDSPLLSADEWRVFFWLGGLTGTVILLGLATGSGVFLVAFLWFREGRHPGVALLSGAVLGSALYLLQAIVM